VNSFAVFLLMASSPVALLLFLAKWVDTDFDTAWDTFETFVEDTLK
jgi:hypothetical protein